MPTALLIDDNTGLRHISARLFHSAGFDVLEASLDGIDLGATPLGFVEVIVVNIEAQTAPRRLARLLQDRAAGPPVIALISGFSAHERAELRALKIERLLDKPVPFPALLAAVEQVTGRVFDHATVRLFDAEEDLL